MSPGSPRTPRPDDPFVAELLARCSFPAGSAALTCAVSGGADSSALLALAVATGRPVTAIHVDHGLRPDSGADARHVARVAAAWGAGFRGERVQLQDGPDLEQRARDARRAVLPADALHGHTADDQAETVLLRLLRGTGPSGLASMRAATHPLLSLRRADTRSLCAHLGVEPREDPTNQDMRFTRNRVRHEVLPLLDRVADRDVVPLLSRLAALAAADAELIEQLARELDPTDAAALAGAPAPVAAAAWRRWWSAATAAAHPTDLAATERVMEVAAGRARSCDVVDGWRVRRTAGRLRLERDAAP